MVMKNQVNMVESIFQRGVIVDLDISWWSGQRSLSPEDLGISEEEINYDLFSLGRKRFIPKRCIGLFRKYEQEARIELSKLGFNFKKSAGWFVPINALPILQEKLNHYKQKFFEVIQNFKNEYPMIKRNMIKAYEEEVDTIYNRMKALNNSKLPDYNTFKSKFMTAVRNFYPESVDGYFKFEWAMFEFSVPRESTLKITTFEKQMAKEKGKRSAEIQAQNDYRNVLNEQIGKFVKQVSTELRASTLDMCEKIRDQFAEGGYTESRLNRLREHIERFKMLNFINDEETSKALEELRKMIDKKSSDDFSNDDALSGKLRKTLSNIVDIASREDKNVLARTFGQRKIQRI